MRKPKPVSNWREAWRWHSTQALAFVGLAPVIWMELPPEAKAYIAALVPAEYHPLILTAVALFGIIGRLRDQSGGQP